MIRLMLSGFRSFMPAQLFVSQIMSPSENFLKGAPLTCLVINLPHRASMMEWSVEGCSGFSWVASTKFELGFKKMTQVQLCSGYICGLTQKSTRQICV